jgi:hypothetical protein
VSKKKNSGLPLLLALLWLGSGVADATTFLRLQSTFLGDGWFQYQMSVMNDPFFTEADITWAGINFTNEIDQSGDSTNWSYAGRNEPDSGWSFTHGIPARPYTETFLIRSSETSYRLGGGTNADGAVFLMSLYLAGIYPGMASGVVSQNIVGYANTPCLIPCRPEDADGSPTNFVYDLKLLPDIRINRLVPGAGGIDGVDFTWGYESTLLLQGTTDFIQWTNIAYIWSSPPETVWSTNQSLGDYGQFFRVELVADGYATNLPPLNNAVSAPQAIAKAGASIMRLPGCRIVGGQVVLDLATQPGQQVQVEAVNANGMVLQKQQLLSKGSSATVDFDTSSLPSPVFFQAVLVP